MEHKANMNYDVLLEETGRLNAESIQALLEREGWERLDAWDDIFIYRRPKREQVFNEIVLPKGKDELYAEYILRALWRYSEFNGVSMEAALEKWKRPGDVGAVRTRREQTPVKNHTKSPKTSAPKRRVFA